MVRAGFDCPGLLDEEVVSFAGTWSAGSDPGTLREGPAFGAVVGGPPRFRIAVTDGRK